MGDKMSNKRIKQILSSRAIINIDLIDLLFYNDHRQTPNRAMDRLPVIFRYRLIPPHFAGNSWHFRGFHPGAAASPNGLGGHCPFSPYPPCPISSPTPIGRRGGRPLLPILRIPHLPL